MAINGLTPVYLLIEKDTGITVSDLNTGTGLMYLFFGLANLITQTLAINFGRRPAAFFAAFVTSFLVLWSSFMQTIAEWYACRILTGITYSAIECLIELYIVDTKLLLERGFHMGFYTWTLFGSALFAPIPVGFLADAMGWRFVNQIYSAIGLLTAIGTFFFFEETMFFRPSVTHPHQNQIKLHSRAIHAKTDEPLSAHKHERKEVEIVSAPSSDLEIGDVYEIETTYRQKLKLWGARGPQQSNTFFKFLTVPLKLLRFPLVVFSGLLVGSSLACFNVVLGTTATIFGGAPYNFSTNRIGLTYFSCMIGISVGCWLSGWANDKLATFLARRNSGTKEPEARLWIALVPVILHPAGCALYGIGAAHGIHWAGVCVGLGIVSMTIVMGATLAFSYVVDCYREVVAESVVTVVLIRNIFGFAFAYAISPMINDLGLQGAFLLVAFVGMAVFASCFLVIASGKSMRKASRSAYWKLVEDYGFTAH